MLSVPAGNFSEAALQGIRPSMEDAHLYRSLAGFPIEPEQQAAVLQGTYKELHKEVKQIQTTAGSTAVTCITHTDNSRNVHFVTANLGDSSAFMLVRNKKTGKIDRQRSQRLNKNLHNSSDQEEKARIERAGGRVDARGRLIGQTGGSMVARAFGDHEFVTSEGKDLVGRDPDISPHSVPLEDDEEIILITACDGLTEPPSKGYVEGSDLDYTIDVFQKAHIIYDAFLLEKLERSPSSVENDHKIAEILARNLHQGYSSIEAIKDVKNDLQEKVHRNFSGITNPDEDDKRGIEATTLTENDNIATIMARLAVTDGSNDNISVMVKHIDGSKSDPELFAVFDGHGGAKVAQYLGDNFLTQLTKQQQQLPDMILSRGSTPTSPPAHGTFPSARKVPAPCPVTSKHKPPIKVIAGSSFAETMKGILPDVTTFKERTFIKPSGDEAYFTEEASANIQNSKGLTAYDRTTGVKVNIKGDARNRINSISIASEQPELKAYLTNNDTGTKVPEDKVDDLINNHKIHAGLTALTNMLLEDIADMADPKDLTKPISTIEIKGANPKLVELSVQLATRVNEHLQKESHPLYTLTIPPGIETNPKAGSENEDIINAWFNEIQQKLDEHVKPHVVSLSKIS